MFEIFLNLTRISWNVWAMQPLNDSYGRCNRNVCPGHPHKCILTGNGIGMGGRHGRGHDSRAKLTRRASRAGTGLPTHIPAKPFSMRKSFYIGDVVGWGMGRLGRDGGCPSFPLVTDKRPQQKQRLQSREEPAQMSSEAIAVVSTSALEFKCTS